MAEEYLPAFVCLSIRFNEKVKMGTANGFEDRVPQHNKIE